MQKPDSHIITHHGPANAVLAEQKQPSGRAGEHTRYRLAAEILDLSDAKRWQDAKREWHLIQVYLSPPDEPGICLCGRYPIREHCVLLNHVNGNTAVVGNRCVQQFLGMPSESLFASLRRVLADNTKPLNPDVVEMAAKQGWISNWEHKFYLDTWDKRRLSTRVKINAQILMRAVGGAGDA